MRQNRPLIKLIRPLIKHAPPPLPIHIKRNSRITTYPMINRGTPR